MVACYFQTKDVSLSREPVGRSTTGNSQAPWEDVAGGMEGLPHVKTAWCTRYGGNVYKYTATFCPAPYAGLVLQGTQLCGVRRDDALT